MWWKNSYNQLRLDILAKFGTELHGGLLGHLVNSFWQAVAKGNM